MSRLRGLALLMILLSGCASDFHQCDRRCREAYGSSCSGERVESERCSCKSQRGDELGRVDRLYPESMPPEMGELVCGVDGKTYPDTPSALAKTRVLHGGACGGCSDPRNIAIYRETSQTLTRYAKECGVIYAIFGEGAARGCFAKTGLTESCNECWVSNMGCTLAHCSGVCLESTLKGEPYVIDGELNECLRCDEMHCGSSFARCAGVNRRRAGVHSDIERAEEEIWVSRYKP